MSYDVDAKRFTEQAAYTERCPVCFIEFVYPQSLENAFRARTQLHIWCPLGHELVTLGKTEADRLRDELTREKQRVEQARADAEFQRARKNMAYRQVAAQKGQVTKIKNRIAKGVCPSCNRTFSDLARHMGSKHPRFAESAV